MHHGVVGDPKVAVGAVIGEIADSRGVEAGVGLELPREAGLTDTLLEEGSPVGVELASNPIDQLGLLTQDLAMSGSDVRQMRLQVLAGLAHRGFASFEKMVVEQV